MSDDATTYYPGQHTPLTPTSPFNERHFHIERVLSRVSTATLAQVKKVTTTGQVAAVGQVDLLPLVNMQDGTGKQFKHQVVHNIPYFRLQGGSKAVILDPKVGDNGVAVFADRDISAVKKNKKQGPPGSWRRFDFADGLFFPCFLGESPTSYIQFQDDGTIVVSPDNGTTVVTIKGNKVTVAISGIVLFAITTNRVDVGCDALQGTNNIALDGGGKIINAWGIPG